MVRQIIRYGIKLFIFKNLRLKFFFLAADFYQKFTCRILNIKSHSADSREKKFVNMIVWLTLTL